MTYPVLSPKKKIHDPNILILNQLIPKSFSNFIFQINHQNPLQKQQIENHTISQENH
jgi:hypothetical protein